MKILKNSLAAFCAIVGLVFLYPFLQFQTEQEQAGIHRFNAVFIACRRSRQVYEVTEFAHVADAVYNDYTERFSVMRRWKSFRGLPVHLRYAATVRTLGKLGQYWIFFDRWRLLGVYGKDVSCLPGPPPYPRNFWQRHDKIRFSAAGGYPNGEP